MATIFEERPRVVEAKDIDAAVLDRVAVKAATRLLEAWRIDNPSSAHLVGVGERTWIRMKKKAWSGELKQDQRMRISGLVGLYQGLHVYFGQELADRWVHMENAGSLFEGRSPLSVMIDDGLPAILAIRDYIDAVRGGL